MISNQENFISKIYICTKFAWYILGVPSSTYKPYFTPFWIQQRILHLLVTSSTKNRRLTYSEFQSNIATLDEGEESVPKSNELLGRNLGGEDFKADAVVCPAWMPLYPGHMSSPQKF